MVGQAVASIALLLLGASGVAKLLDPKPTSGALRSAGLPSGLTLSRLLGVTELLAAVIGLAVGALALIPAVLLYVAFALFTLAAVRGQIPLQTCGCFGRDDTPPSLIHVFYNATAVVALSWTAISGTPSLPWGEPWFELLLFVVFAALGAFASLLLLARLPLALRAGSDL